jgi:uncharacterized OsmC-like protein
MPTVRVTHLANDRFEIGIRGHVLTVDQPITDGGEDTAPTPTDLFTASLAACVAHYARRYLARHALPTEGLAVVADWEMASSPARVGAIHVRLTVPEGVPQERRAALLAVASHCTVHNTLERPPLVTVTESDAAGMRDSA